MDYILIILNFEKIFHNQATYFFKIEEPSVTIVILCFFFKFKSFQHLALHHSL